MNFYDYLCNNDPFNLKLTAANRKWSRYSVDFPTAFRTTHPVLGAGQGDYFQPSGVKNTPLVILLHGIGDRSIIPCKFLARALASQGIASFILYLPVHSRRMTPDMKRRFPRLTNDEWAEDYRISVVNVRQIIDWAERQTDIDNRHIGLIGISFGGFISAITMGIDKRISSSALIVMGGNSAKVSQLSRLRSTRRRYGLPEEQYRQLQATYAKYLEEVAQQGLDNVTPPVPSFLTDSLTYASFLRDRRVYMLNARWDEAVPQEATLDFWEASGKPEITWLPTAHASIWLWYPLIKRRISRFFQQTLAGDDTAL
jgi:predicted esterase